MTVVTLPFPVSALASHPPELDYRVYEVGDSFDHLESTAFWVPPYPGELDYAAAAKAMPDLRVVQTQTAGVENVAAFLDARTTLCNAAGVHDAATAEMGMALILSVLRQIPRFVRAQDRGLWDRDNTAESLADKTVLVVGYGNIGRALGRRLDGFEAQVVPFARSARDGVLPISELDQHLPTADVVVMLVPLTPDTHHLVDADFLGAMKDGALLVNLARGPVVDTEALMAELRAGRLFAGLDVTDPEPLPSSHPLWSMPNLLITPHSGGGTSAMAPRLQRLVESQLWSFSRSEPLANVVHAGW